MSKLITTLEDYKFPVKEADVGIYFGDGILKTNNYKAIVREDTEQLVSIVKSSYRIVPNSELIDKLMNELEILDTPYVLNSSHCFLTNQRMKIHVEFPELIFNDGESDCHISLYLHNSYDGTEGVRMFWGAIRLICTNGMIIAKILSRFYHRHTQGINLDKLPEAISKTYDSIPQIQERIKTLATLPVPAEMWENVKKIMGKNFVEGIKTEFMFSATMYMLYNVLTHHVSHNVSATQQTKYQVAFSKMFKL